VLLRLSLEAGGTLVTDGAGGKTFLTYPVEIVQVMPRKSAASQVPLLFGNLRQAARLGDRKAMTVAVSESNRTEFTEDLLSIRGIERFDVNVHDVGNASADEEEREAGPVVGLITRPAA
jgi:HK97 family phage major capsid protein